MGNVKKTTGCLARLFRVRFGFVLNLLESILEGLRVAKVLVSLAKDSHDSGNRGEHDDIGRHCQTTGAPLKIVHVMKNQ